MDAEYFLKANYEDLANLVRDKVDETPSLEFKRKALPDQSELQRGDKKLLGEVVSGFANATGGVLVLGIGTEKVAGIDQASTLAPISQLNTVAGRYRAYVGECVSPPVAGVMVQAVDDGSGKGFIVVFVPQGQARPHMSRAPDHHTYYRRVMDSFVPMEAYEVEEMMRLRTSPELQLVYDMQPAGSIGDNLQYHILFGLENVGKVTAKFPYIQYMQRPNQPSPAQYGLTGNGPDLWPRVSAAATRGPLFSAGADQVLHPGQSLYVSKLEISQRSDERFGRYWALDRIRADEPLELVFAFGCEDHPRTEAKVTMTKAQIMSAGS